MRAQQLHQVRRLVIRSLLPIAARGLSALGSIALVYFLSRHLGADHAGGFLWCVALTGMLATATRVGLDNVLVRRAALLGQEGGASSLAAITVSALCVILPPLLLAVAVLALLPAQVAGLQGHPEVAAVLPWFALALLCNVLTVVASRLLIGRHRTTAGLVVEGVLLPGLFMLVAWPVALMGLPLAARLYALSALAVLLVALLLLARERPGRELGDVRAGARGMLASGVPLWIAMVMADVSVWGGQLIVGMLSPARDVALLAVAQRIASAVSLILQAVRAVVAPRFAALYASGDRAGLRRLALASSVVNLVWGAPLLLLVFILPEQILGLFGHDYVAARNVLLILALGQMVNAGVGNWGALLAMTGHEVQLRNISIGTGVLALVLMPVAVLLGGLTGAALVMAGTVILQNLLTMRFGRTIILRDPHPHTAS